MYAYSLRIHSGLGKEKNKDAMEPDKKTNTPQLIVLVVICLICLLGMLSQLFESKWLAAKVTYAFTSGFMNTLGWLFPVLGAVGAFIVYLRRKDK